MPTAAKLLAFDRKRKRKSTSNKEARIAKLKDDRAHMAYKPEHVVALESGSIVLAVVHPADQGDTRRLATTLLDVQVKLEASRMETDLTMRLCLIW